MTLEDVYYISQSVSVLAILVSLIFVIRQLRQSQKMERAAAQRDLLLRVSEWTRMVNQDSDGTYDRFLRGLREYDTAYALTQMVIDKALSEFVFIAESALNMHRDGFFSDGTWAGIDGGVLALIRTLGGQQWWAYGQNFIGPEIVEHLKRRLTEIDPATPTFVEFSPAYANRLKELDAEAEKPTAED
jgi:hypothetical protein